MRVWAAAPVGNARMMAARSIDAPPRVTATGPVGWRSIRQSRRRTKPSSRWRTRLTAAPSIDRLPSAVNLMRQRDDGFVLRLDWRIDRHPTGPVAVTLGGGSIDLAAIMRALPIGAAVQTRIPLRCFSEAGANLTAVGAPIRIQAAKGLVATVRNVNVEAANDIAPCPGKVR